MAQQTELLKEAFLPKLQRLGSVAARLKEKVQMQRAAEAEAEEVGEQGAREAGRGAGRGAQHEGWMRHSCGAVTGDRRREKNRFGPVDRSAQLLGLTVTCTRLPP